MGRTEKNNRIFVATRNLKAVSYEKTISKFYEMNHRNCNATKHDTVSYRQFQRINTHKHTLCQFSHRDIYFLFRFFASHIHFVNKYKSCHAHAGERLNVTIVAAYAVFMLNPPPLRFQWKLHPSFFPLHLLLLVFSIEIAIQFKRYSNWIVRNAHQKQNHKQAMPRRREERGKQSQYWNSRSFRDI